MLLRAAALLFALALSGCMAPGKLPTQTSPDFFEIQKVEIAPIGVPQSPRVRILNSDSDWFHIPGFVAKAAYTGHAGGEVGELLRSVGFDYGEHADRSFEQAVLKAGLPVARSAAARPSEQRNWPLSKCPQQASADACFDVHLTYFGYVAAFDRSDYVPTAHISARVIRARDAKVIFERNIHYNPIDPGKAIDVFAASEFRFHDLDAMRADPQGVAAGLKAALDALAVELEMQLRNAQQ